MVGEWYTLPGLDPRLLTFMSVIYERYYLSIIWSYRCPPTVSFCCHCDEVPMHATITPTRGLCVGGVWEHLICMCCWERDCKRRRGMSSPGLKKEVCKVMWKLESSQWKRLGVGERKGGGGSILFCWRQKTKVPSSLNGRKTSR